MKLTGILPSTINWSEIENEKINGENGFSLSKTKILGDLRIRQVHYSIHYMSDHWCVKGHIIHVLEGELIIEYKDGRNHPVFSGKTYVVGDDGVPHKARSVKGAKVLVID